MSESDLDVFAPKTLVFEVTTYSLVEEGTQLCSLCNNELDNGEQYVLGRTPDEEEWAICEYCSNRIRDAVERGVQKTEGASEVTFSVKWLVPGDDYVLVGPATKDGFAFNQLRLANSLDSPEETLVIVTEPIPEDTPASGTLRIQANSLARRRVSYLSWSESTFVIEPTDFDKEWITSPGREIMISYIYRLASAPIESFTTRFVSPRRLYVKIRNIEKTTQYSRILSAETDYEDEET